MLLAVSLLSSILFGLATSGEQMFLTAKETGILPMAVNFTFFVAYISMGAAFVFFLVQRGSVAPEYKTALTLSALIVGIAAFHYFYMKGLYSDTLPLLAQNSASQADIARRSFLSIINFRYMDWLVTTPLLVAKIPLAVAAGRKVGKTIAALMLFDVLMIVAGFIGEQQLTTIGVAVGPRLFWGAISTVGYVGIVYLLFTRVRKWAADSSPDEAWAVKWMSVFVVTGWGIYPIGYMVPALFPDANLNWVHLVYNVGDAINKIGPGLVLYLAGHRLMMQRATQEGRMMPAGIPATV